MAIVVMFILRLCIKNAIADRIALLALSIGFLAYAGINTLIVFSSIALLTYFGVQFVQSRAEPRKKWLAILVIFQIGALVYFKYAGFFFYTVTGEKLDLLTNVIIPLGISFYTFQLIAYAVDSVKNNLSTPRFLDFVNFAAFFPQILSGPVPRREQLLPQMQGWRLQWNLDNINHGARYFMLGLFFKIALSNNIDINYVKVINAWSVWIEALTRTLKIYFDFAGYSFMALGIARVFGIELVLNFKSPYIATNMVDFWRRWHISMSLWFRDYVYIPLGGSRTRFVGLITLITFTVSGVWHGAGWNFILWGFLNGAFILLARAFKGKLYSFLGWILTMLAQLIMWFMFFEPDTQALLGKLALLVTPSSYSYTNFMLLGGTMGGYGIATLAACIVISATIIYLEFLSEKKRTPYYYLLHPISIAILTILTFIFAPANNNDFFIYFAF